MPKSNRKMTSLEMRNLILEALALENQQDTPRGQTFQMHCYKGCVSDLRAIVEHLAIKHDLIDKVINIPNSAWGVPGEILRYQTTTNFDDDEINLFSEEVHLLISQNVLSPGATGKYGNELPYFHVTQYGKECLMQRDLLPYDPENYLNKLKTISSFDEWEHFYISQSLTCFNVGALESSLLMLGLAGEYLATRLIDSMMNFLQRHEEELKQSFEESLRNKRGISTKFAEYERILNQVRNLTDDNNDAKYPSLKRLSQLLDQPAKAVYATYLRLNRNEIAHPSQIIVDRVECLTMFVCFVKYCEIQHKYLDFFSSNS